VTTDEELRWRRSSIFWLATCISILPLDVWLQDMIDTQTPGLATFRLMRALLEVKRVFEESESELLKQVEE
jgi:hypothetical protein